MLVERLPSNTDIGFTDLLTPGVGTAVGGRNTGDCACSMTGASLIVTIAAGVIWGIDTDGSSTGIVGSLLRQVLAAPTTVPLAANVTGLPRVDIVVAVAAAAWGGAPTIAVRQGAATNAATARNLIGASALTAGDVPLLAVVIPAAGGGNPAALAARVSTANAEDLRVIAADRTPPGKLSYHSGAVAPVGYKIADGRTYAAIGPYADMMSEVGATYGGGLPDERGRTRIGSGTGAGLTARALGAKSGEETHVLSAAELAAHHHDDGGLQAASHAHASSVQAGLSVMTADVGVGVHWSFAGAGGDDIHLMTGTTGDSGALDVAGNTGNTGGDTPHNNMQPYLAVLPIVKL